MKPTFSKLCCLVLCVMSFVLLMSNNVEAEKKLSKRVKYCKFETLFQMCGVEPNLMFTYTQNGSGIANSQEEMEQYCYNVVDFLPNCLTSWFKICGTDIHKDLVFTAAINPLKTSMQQFCDVDGPIRNEFLKYSNCLIHHVKLSPAYRRECIRPLQAAGEWIHEREFASPRPSLANFTRDTCCSYNKWEACILRHLTVNCGKPSADVFPYLIHQSSLEVVRQMCKPLRYDPEDPKVCDKSKYIAPESFKPRGLHSTSFLSYVFSYGCPNVGWGIVPERDW